MDGQQRMSTGWESHQSLAKSLRNECDPSELQKMFLNEDKNPQPFILLVNCMFFIALISRK